MHVVATNNVNKSNGKACAAYCTQDSFLGPYFIFRSSAVNQVTTQFEQTVG